MSSRWMEDIDSGSTSDPTLAGKIKECYNEIEVDGSNLTLSNASSGVTKTVVVSGGSSASINALNNATLASNTITFTSTTGASADEVNVDLGSSTLAGSVASNLGNITLLHSNVTTNVGNIAANTTNIATNAADIATNVTDITTNTTNIATNSTNIATNTTNIATNVTDIATNVTNISALETNTLNCFESASISGSNLTLTPLSGTATTLTLPAGGTGSGDSITFDMTVQSVSGNNKFFVNDFQGGLQDIEILIGHKYLFNYPVAHPIRFSLTNDGIHSTGGVEYTTGVTYNSPNGLDQTQTEIIINTGSEMLYYYCPNHADMGGFLRIAGIQDHICLMEK